MTGDALPSHVASLLAAIDARPDDVPLRLHAGSLLLEHGDAAGAIAQCSAVLQLEPVNREAVELLQRATDSFAPPRPKPTLADRLPQNGFDWPTAEREISEFIEGELVDDMPGDAQVPELGLADIGGMEAVKRRLEISFLAPMRNPELKRIYRKSLSGGLLLYGPPGCGKTFLARALAGELTASFLSFSVADVLDSYVGSSERNVQHIFETARRNAPAVLFLDELDAIGQKRSHLRGNPMMRATVNQLLTEMDSVNRDNTDVFILGATNHPWDIDNALIRPGRFDRMVLVSPPDAVARDAIVRYHLRDRPLEGIDVGKLVKRTEHFSGADIAHLCDSAGELALEHSINAGVIRPIRMRDFDQALREIKPSTGAWLEDAKNVVMFANGAGKYDDLLQYLKGRKLL